MADIAIALPGGDTRRVVRGTRAADALDGVPGVERAVAARLDGQLIDLSSGLERDGTLVPVFPESSEGLEVVRHSTAHLMAQAVKRLFADVQVTIGPTIEGGFYYDFQYGPGFRAEDLPRIEAEMLDIVRADLKVEREEVSRAEAIRLFEGMGEAFKVELLRGISDERVSLYRQGEFVDLCRGPHVPSTGALGVFKLTSVAGAYWRGDERNPMLQRIYGTAFPTSEELARHLERIEEARRRDHRRLGRELDLFSFHPVAPGSPFFHPKGAVVYNLLVDYVRRLYVRYGYEEVITPQIFDAEMWRRSGHYENFRDALFLLRTDEREYGVKPMNCPGHTYVFAARRHSYRDLPRRYADFGRLHRFEKSGVLHGLTRVRSFAQDDAHIFCAPEDVEIEVRQVIRMAREVYATFGFGSVSVALSTRPQLSIGDDQMWARAEEALARALEREGLSYDRQEGEGAFYGPKIDFSVEDALGRSWQLSTIQLDFAMPERFDLVYVTSEGREARPAMIHRALLGSIERFLGIVLEHTGGMLPLWLAPVQVRLVTVADRHASYAHEVAAHYRGAGLRVEVDARNEKLGYKIREAQMEKIPYVLVIGEREVAGHQVAPRRRGGERLPAQSPEEFLERLQAERQEQGGAQ